MDVLAVGIGAKEVTVVHMRSVFGCAPANPTDRRRVPAFVHHENVWVQHVWTLVARDCAGIVAQLAALPWPRNYAVVIETVPMSVHLTKVHTLVWDFFARRGTRGSMARAGVCSAGRFLDAALTTAADGARTHRQRRALPKLLASRLRLDNTQVPTARAWDCVTLGTWMLWREECAAAALRSAACPFNREPSADGGSGSGAGVLPECSVCLTELATDEGAGVLTMSPCGHKFHGACIRDWARRSPTCPLCRERIVADTPVPSG
jgi:hypothetical protein